MPSHRADRRNAFEALQAIQMTHGQVLWILSEFGFRTGVTPETFNYYIKSLRKLGVPFVRGETGLMSGRLAWYSFNHVMELSIVLSLRVYAILPDLVVGGLIRFRRKLYDAYRRAYLESDAGTGAPIVVGAEGVQHRFTMRGVYLDLQLAYSTGQLVSIGPPRILTPFEALEWFATTASPARAHPPLNVSEIALRLADLMEHAPRIRRGPKPLSGSLSTVAGRS
jgi:hypothetical protein